MTAAVDPGDLLLLDPWFLLGIPLLLLLLGHRLWRQRAALPAASTALFAGLPRTLRQRLVHLPLCGMTLAGCILCVALARPVRREMVPTRELGVDIVLVVDTSSSMQWPDMDDSGQLRRMDVARDRALEFAKARKNDRTGLITFARLAELRCPPTLDENALAAFVRSIDTVERGSELDMTAIGPALVKAGAVLKKSQAKAKVVVLLSDGENNLEEIPAADGIKLVADAGIRVHTIGIGKGNPDPFGRQVPLEFKVLQAAAQQTGGRFFTARSDRELASVYAEIDRLEKSELQDPRYRHQDAFALPLLAGLLLLAVALLLQLTVLRGAP